MATEHSNARSESPIADTPPRLYPVPRKPLHDRSSSVSSFRVSSAVLESPPLLSSNQSWVSSAQQLEEKQVPSVNHRRSWRPRLRWTVELLATLLSLLAFAALVVVLQHYNGRTQTAWPYHRLTLNGLVALLSSITRAALLVPVAASLGQTRWNWFSSSKQGTMNRRPLRDLEILDEASRGAWGSIQLLWRTKGCYVVSIGALIMIVSLAFDTFSQQVLAVDFRQVADTHNMSAAVPMPHSNYFDFEDDRTFTASGPDGWIDLPLRGVIYQAIFGSNTTRLQATCATGNCDYPVIPSLGVCGGCTDVTKNISSDGCSGSNCSYGLANDGGRIFTAIDDSNSIETLVFMMMGIEGDVYQVEQSEDGRFVAGVLHTPAYLANFLAIGTVNQSLDPSHFFATECALWVCVQALNVSVRSGRQFESALPPHSSPVSMGWPDLFITDLPPDFNSPPNASFGIHMIAYQGLRSFLKDTVFSSGRAYGNLDSASKPMITFSDTVTQAMWAHNGDLDRWIQNIASSMSDYFRLASPATYDAEHYISTTYYNEAFVRVRWPWLTFPAGMVLASVGFFLATVWRTCRSSVRAWKTSALALLVMEVDEGLRAAAEGSLEDIEGPITSIGQREVLLEERDGSWVFSGD